MCLWSCSSLVPRPTVPLFSPSLQSCTRRPGGGGWGHLPPWKTEKREIVSPKRFSVGGHKKCPKSTNKIKNVFPDASRLFAMVMPLPGEIKQKKIGVLREGPRPPRSGDCFRILSFCQTLGEKMGQPGWGPGGFLKVGPAEPREGILLGAIF